MTKITLADQRDASHFAVGHPIRMAHDGRSVRAGRIWRERGAAARTIRSMTRWWRPRSVVTDIDEDLGRITLGTERWSWRRWRWERD